MFAPLNYQSSCSTIPHFTSDPNQQLFFFNPEGEGLSALQLLDTPKEQRNYIDIGCYMRVRVEEEVFSDDEPGPPQASEGVAVVRERINPPYSITVRPVAIIPAPRP